MVSIANSTISGNSAGRFGGGVFQSDYNLLTITDTTISGNSAGERGGGLVVGGSEGGYIAATITRSIVAGNKAGCSGEEVASSPFFDTSANDFNLFGRSGINNATAFSGFTPSGSDITATSDGTTPTPLIKILDPTLRKNGANTKTHALVKRSPAIDAAGPGCPPPATDQRGADRPKGRACDIGAFEFRARPVFGPPAPPPATQPTDGPLSSEKQACVLNVNKVATAVSASLNASTTQCISLTGRATLTSPVRTDDGFAACGDVIDTFPGKKRPPPVEKKRQRTIKTYQKFCDGITPPIIGNAEAINGAHTDESLNLAEILFGNDLHNATLPRTLFGPPLPAKLRKKLQKKATSCLTTPMKEAGKLWNLSMASFTSCLESGIKSGAIVDSESLQSTCLRATFSDVALEKARVKIRTLIDKAIEKGCAPDGTLGGFIPAPPMEELFPTGACAEAASSLDPLAFPTCIDTQVRCYTCRTLNTANNMTADCDAFDNGKKDGSCAGHGPGNSCP